MTTHTVQKKRRRGDLISMYGELERTTCNQWFYVNGATGSDDSGDGTSTNPYATPNRAMERVPEKLAHTQGIVVSGGDYGPGAWPRKIDNIREPGGLLMILCPEAPVQHKKDIEITDADRLTGGTWRLECSAENWDDHELAGYMVSGVDNDGNAYLRAISDNTEDTVLLRPTDNDPKFIVGGVFDIVRPAAMFTMDEAPIFQIRDHAGETCAMEDDAFAPLALIGIGLDCSGVSDVQQWAIEGGGASLYAQCVQLIGTWEGYGSHIRNCSINIHLPDAPFILAGLETIYPGLSKMSQGAGLCLVDKDGAAGLYYSFSGQCTAITGLVIAGILDFADCHVPSGIWYSSCMEQWIGGGSSGNGMNLLVVGFPGSGFSAVNIGGILGASDFSFYELYTINGKNAIEVIEGSSVLIYDCDCDPKKITAVGVRLISGARCVVMSTAYDMLGDDGAYDNGNGAVLAWPDDETAIYGGEHIINIPAVDASLSALDGRVTALEQGAETPPTQDSTGLQTWVNKGGATVAELPIGLSIHAPASATENLRILKKAAPAAPYEITARVKLMSPTGNYFSVGIGWRDPGTGKLETAALDSQSAMQVGVFRRSDPQTWVSETVAYNTTYWREVWLRIADDGTNRICSFSLDGENFIAFDSVAKAAGYLGAAGYAEIVFYTNCFNAGAECWGTLLSYIEDVVAI